MNNLSCCLSLLTPYNPGNFSSANCCNLLLPPPINSGGSGGSNLCSQINCSSYTPRCFSVSGSDLCSYLYGIDSAICALQVGQSAIPCASVVMNGANSCLINPPASSDLCDWATAVNATFCAINAKLNPSPGGGTSGGLILDGAGGTLTGLGGMAPFGGATQSITSSPAHGSSTGSLQISG